jgi:hypothetical protein
MDAKTNPRGKIPTPAPAADAATSKDGSAGAHPFKSKKRAPKAPPRVWPKAKRTITAALDRPAQPFKRAAPAPAGAPGAVKAGGVSTAAVAVSQSAGPPKGSYAPTLRVRAAEPKPEPARGPVVASTPSNASKVKVSVRSAPPGSETRDPPNAPIWRFPPPRAAALPPPAPALPPPAARRLAGAIARARAAAPQDPK